MTQANPKTRYVTDLPEAISLAAENAGIPNAERDNLVVSMLSTDKGNAVISRYGDMTWDFSPYINNANWNAHKKVINWSSIPASFVEGAKSVVYSYWTYGTPGRKRPRATTICGTFAYLKWFVVWLKAHNIARFTDIRPLHCRTYAQSCIDRNVSASTKCHLLAVVELIYTFREKGADPMREHPWPGTNCRRLSGYLSSNRSLTPQTDIIPRPILQTLFERAEAALDEADSILSEVEENGGQFQHRNKAMIRLRNACYFILGITTGCRNHELASIEVNAATSTVHNGETYHWLRGASLKTYEGRTQWMMPEIGVRAVSVMERWSKPYRTKIKANLELLEADLERGDGTLPAPAKLQILAQLRADANRLFLGHGPNGNQITTLSSHSWGRQLVLFAKECNVDWPLAPHQLRRTFAAMAAHHALGDLRYLKHHFKHWSIDMSALYALNEKQEEELFDEVIATIRERKVSIMLNLLNPDTLLAGKTATHIQGYRKTIEITKMDRQALIEDTADKVHLRGTGHSWCLSAQKSCGGRGLYEKTYCAASGCKNALIPDYFAPVYKGLYDQLTELGAYADELGPGGRERVARDLAECKKVLVDFGIEVD